MPTKRDLPSIGVKDASQGDPGFLRLEEETRDPAKHYRWVRKRSDEHFMSVTTTKMHGYSVEYYSLGGVQPVAELNLNEGDEIVIGDLILMSCPIEVFEHSQAAQLARTDALKASTSAQTEKRAKEMGLKLVNESSSQSVSN